ncbi:MAG: hypothetical protein PF541_17755 [Prolixibacteraceae bacterium]|jgi:hypothetical protein|nr:hypothetical protein [Prolixibacteraceae bacterium]
MNLITKLLKTVLLMGLLCIGILAKAQTDISFNTSIESMVSSGESQAFWLTHNQLGKYPLNNKANHLLAFEGKARINKPYLGPLSIELGTNLIASYSADIETQVNEAYAKAFLWGWKLEGGWFREKEYFSGLSSTNGDLEKSNNARPHPKIRFGTNEFIPFLFWKNWFSFKAEYDEGWLNDQRVVMGTRLHHKSLYTRFQINPKSSFHVGLNHYVMWGGLSPNPNIGQMPEGFKDYFVYITGSPGTENFPQTDIANVAGNQFGSYHLQYNYETKSLGVTAYINHLFDDHSGMELENYPDNLYGIHLQFKQFKVLEAVVYEYLYTLHQGGKVDVAGVEHGNDNYYNHGVYRSGYSYQGWMLSSPIFSPLVYDENNVVTRIENTRIIMHHLGLKGKFNDAIRWDAKLTYTQNYGTHNRPFDPVKNQFFSVVNAHYSSTLPFDITLSLAADRGSLYENRVGSMLRISRTF